MARIDFHVHTPASGDFLGGGTVLEVLREARQRGTDILVLTDHNTLDGYLGVLDELEQFEPMLVLPGVEVTCRGGSSGIHILAVFDPEQLGKRPRWILKALGLGADDRHENGISSLDLVGVCGAIHHRGGLAVAAHAASGKGVLNDLKGLQLGRTLEQCSLDAFELSTASQRKRGSETLARLGLMTSATVVQSTDSHRARAAPGQLRGEGPGDRVTTLELEGPPSFKNLREAMQSAAGRFEPEPAHRTPLELFHEGLDSAVVAVWNAHDRRGVTSAVAASASAGNGVVLVGVRRGGRAGRGIVLAQTTPTRDEVEQWIWTDVAPLPAVEVDRYELDDRSYLVITVRPDLNPFVYGVGGSALLWSSGRVKSAHLSTPDHAEVLGTLRQTVSTELLERVVDPRPDALREQELELLFPWRGYLTDVERMGALRKVAYWISKASDSGVLRAWAFTGRDAYAIVAMELVRDLTRAFTVSEAKRGLRKKLEEVGASRALRRQVLSTFGTALDVTDPLGLAELAPSTDVLQRACERLAEAVSSEELSSKLRDAAIDEGKRSSELVGSLITDEQVQVVIDAVVGEFGEDAREGIALTLVQAANPMEVVRVDDAAGVAGREIVLVGSDGDDILTVGAPIVAVHAPVRDLGGLLRTHREIAKFREAHVMQRDELLALLDDRHTVGLTDEDRVIVFRSCVRLGLPAWWSVGDDFDLERLAKGLGYLVANSRIGTELAHLLRYLAVLPGDHGVAAADATQRSRAAAVQEMARIHEMGWEQRLAELVASRQDLVNIDANAVTYAGQVIEIGGLSIVEILRTNQVDQAQITRQVAEACGRRLRDVASEAAFDVLLLGLSHGWQTVTALRRCDEATFLPEQIRAAVPGTAQ